MVVSWGRRGVCLHKGASSSTAAYGVVCTRNPGCLDTGVQAPPGTTPRGAYSGSGVGNGKLEVEGGKGLLWGW